MNTDYNIKFDHILVRYGELSTKGKNKKDFIKCLLQNVKNALREFSSVTYEKTHDRLYIMLHGEDATAIANHLCQVFGISSFSFTMKVESEIGKIEHQALKIALQSEAKTFKIITRRSDKQFPHRSDEINRRIASLILQSCDKKVDVKRPELAISIEIHREDTYVMIDRIQGAKGYPVGVGGRALVMLSGGIDSPIAAYMTMKRGVKIECIHYASPPYTSQAALYKVECLAEKLSLYQGSIVLHIVPFTDLQMAIYNHCDEPYAITIMRRMMYRIAQEICRKRNLLAIVNGESIGQVASQTLESIQCINTVVDMPVIRPCACMDKLEIIEKANDIETYQTSIQPFEDCCTIFTPKNPVTKPTIERALRNEEKFDYEVLLNDCIEKTELKTVRFPRNDKDIF